MPGASRLDCRNQRHPAFFMSVWSNPECGARDDTNTCDGGYAGYKDSKLCVGCPAIYLAH